jgi:hypothetical protein
MSAAYAQAKKLADSLLVDKEFNVEVFKGIAALAQVYATLALVDTQREVADALKVQAIELQTLRQAVSMR